ncbi:MAG: carboxypeptidase regulatory-like domain-containing protein [Acidobacteriota bacterium]
MNRTRTSRWLFAMVSALALIVVARPAWAQNVTTGILSGVVADQQGAVLPGVTVTANHEPTGTKYEGITAADGRYQLPNVRVGPYTVTATLGGFRDKTESSVTVALGEDRAVDFKLSLATVTETVTVVASAPIIDTARAGTAANISKDAIENLPTIQRGIFDFARTSSFVNASPDSAGSDTSISIAGRNNRYNNMQIDGAVNNDVFGIPSAGVPGGQTGSQPISLDAIQEVQIVVAPYDVRQGGFSGGAVNAVTKSGTNTFGGTGYWFGRNEGLIGQIPGIATPGTPSPADTKIGAFKDQQGGFSFGGPVARNKAFFFGNLDLARKSTPVGFSADGSSGQTWGGLNAGGVPAHLADIQQVVTISKSLYGYDPGPLGEVTTPTNSNKIFVRGDFNLSRRNLLTARVNYVSSSRQLTSSGVPSTLNYAFPNNYYTAEETVLSPVVQLNTTFTHAYNEFRFTYTRDRFGRNNPGLQLFPYVRVDFPDGLNVRLGTENSSHANKLNQDIVELTDDVTWVKGKHTITLGTHNELFHFWNLFIQNLYGQWEFFSIQNFQAGLGQFYSHGFSNTADPQQPAEFGVQQLGGYIGDQWRVRSNVTLTYGVRLDVPRFPDTPHANPLTVTDFGLRTDAVPTPKMWSPRIGFNWDLSQGATSKSQIRGGIGYFTGRTPYVWLSNQYGNTGVDFTTISTSVAAGNSIPFVADPNAQPLTVTGAAAGRQSVNLIDPDYKYPSVVRGNIAYDRDLGFWGLVGTGELLLSKNVNEVAYQNINFVPSSALPDGRIVYRKVDANLNDALLLTNTSLGSTWTASFKVERPFRNGLYASGSYLYNDARSINDGTASTAGSNWANTPIGIDTNNPPLTRSNFSVGSRLNLTGVVPIPLGKNIHSTASFFYNGQSGRPYVILFNGDANLDNRSNNDIAFVPATADQVILQNGTWDQLNAFISSDPASKDNRGTIPARNSGRAPWSNSLDFRYGVTVPTGGKTKVELTMDIINVLNLLNKEWGWQYFPLFPSSSANGLIGYGGIDPATGKERLNLSTITSPNFQGTFQRDDLRSRWQAQWGVRVRF